MSRLYEHACRTVITLDYDIPYHEFTTTLYNWLKKRAEKLNAYLACWQSTSGNTHCSMCLPIELSEIERLAYETFFLDDPIRIVFNLERLIEFGRLHDRLFIYKAILRASHSL